MQSKHGLPVKEGMLDRSRINALIAHGLEHGVLTVTAGPGYGKTQAVANALDAHEARIAWLRLSSLDNLHTRFWEGLAKAVEKEFPKLSKHMRALGFPDTLLKLDAFVRMLAETVYDGGQAAWVFDDFGAIDDEKIMVFFHTLAEANLEDFCLVLLSTSKANIDSVSFRAESKVAISGEELRFSREEIRELYLAHGIALNDVVLKQIEAFSEGWPLPLHLLLLRYDKSEPFESMPSRITTNEVYRMFEQGFFIGYSPQVQRLLIKLSHLNGFTWELARELYAGGAMEDVRQLGDNLFIIRHTMDLHFFHNLYQRFLLEKNYLLGIEEEKALYQTAALYFAQRGMTVEAVTSYRKCGDYERMLSVICDFSSNNLGMTIEYADFFLEHIGLLSQEQLRRFPVADYLVAYIHLNTLDIGKSEAILLDLERRLQQDSTPDSQELLGEVYALLGALHMMCSREDFGAYYQKACEYLPNGSKFKGKTKLLTGNIHNFSMQSNAPGARESMEHAVHQGVPWMVQALNGGMYGMEQLFSAEANYLCCRLEEARQYAYCTIFKAQEKAQHDLVMNAHIILARISFMNGDFEGMKQEIEHIISYADKHENRLIYEIRDTAMAWYYIQVDDFEKIPRWIIFIKENNQIPITYGRDHIIYANYLIRKGEFAKVAAFLEHPEGLYLSHGIWQDRICLHVMLAIGCMQLGNKERAVDTLWAAYDMAHENGIVSPFVEGGKYMRGLIELVRAQNDGRFAPAWLEDISKRAQMFSKQTARVRKAYDNTCADRATKERGVLSKRELEILVSLSQGLTREEIAGAYYISINTVKATITNIYNKLGAVNRADAVFIATSKGYLG